MDNELKLKFELDEIHHYLILRRDPLESVVIAFDPKEGYGKNLVLEDVTVMKDESNFELTPDILLKALEFAKQNGFTITDVPEELSVHFLQIWDQTIGCALCDKADWDEDNTEDPTLFHDQGCMMYALRSTKHYNVPYIEKKLGREIGCPHTLEGFRKLSKTYVTLYEKEKEAHYHSLRSLCLLLTSERELCKIDNNDRRAWLEAKIKEILTDSTKEK